MKVIILSSFKTSNKIKDNNRSMNIDIEGELITLRHLVFLLLATSVPG